MKFEVRKNDLSNAIKTVLPFTGKLNEFTDIKFLVNGNILKLVAQSENASNIYKLNVEADEDFEFSVNGSEINNIVDTFKSEITITKENDLIFVTTKGYGHGVGLSQYGANGMAKNGYSYIYYY